MLYWIWEHRLVPTNYGTDLVRALEALPDGALVAEGLKGSALYVRIDPAALDPELLLRLRLGKVEVFLCQVG